MEKIPCFRISIKFKVGPPRSPIKERRIEKTELQLSADLSVRLQFDEPPLPGVHRGKRPLLPCHRVPLPRVLLRQHIQRQGQTETMITDFRIPIALSFFEILTCLNPELQVLIQNLASE